MDQTKLFKKYEKLLHKWAHSYNRTTGIEHEELYAEACLAYVYALQTYNPEKKVKMSTWISSCVKNKLNDFIKQFKNSYTVYDEEVFENIPVDERYNALFSYSDLLTELSPKGQQLCSIVIKMEIELQELPPKTARGKIQQQLRNESWSWPDIWQTYNELKQVLNR